MRLQVVPANRSIYRAALSEGLIETLHDAGAVVFPPSAALNQAVNMGAMSEEEVMISNQARNFPAGTAIRRRGIIWLQLLPLQCLHGKVTSRISTEH